MKDRKIQDADPEVVRAWQQDFVNFCGDKLSFGGKSYPVNPNAAQTLRKTYKDVIALIRQDYALKNRRFVANEIRGKRIRKITRFGNKVYDQWKDQNEEP